MRESLTTIEKALVLKEIEYFRDASVEQLSEIASVATELHFAAGDVIVEPTDPSDQAYALIEGDVVVERDGIVTHVISARARLRRSGSPARAWDCVSAP